MTPLPLFALMCMLCLPCSSWENQVETHGDTYIARISLLEKNFRANASFFGHEPAEITDKDGYAAQLCLLV